MTVKYSPEIAKEIARRLANGESLRSICRDANMPDESSVRGWVIYNKFEFAQVYREARDIGLDCMADEILDIADDGSNDYMIRETKRGAIVVVDKENAARSKLRVETRKWYLCKMYPKKYGDRIAQEITNPDGSLRPKLNQTQIAIRLDAIHKKAKQRMRQAQEGAPEDGSDLV